MSKPMIRIHNAETNEVIDREMNDAEYAQHLQKLEAKAIKDAEAAAKTAQKQAVLDRLGLTAEEAQLLLGGN